MAYSDYGAFVKRNGKRRKDKEDVGVFDTDEAKLPSGQRIFANILKRQKETGEDRKWYNHSHHAVLGDGPVRLCGYKQHAELWYIDDQTKEVVNFKLPELDYPGAIKNAHFTFFTYDKKGELTWDDPRHGDYKYEIKQYMNKVDLTFIEPDGTKWTARCGYMYGAGLTKEDGTPLKSN